MTTEIELKFRLDSKDRDHFLNVMDKRDAKPLWTKRVLSIYYDTPDRALRQAGIGFRIRKRGEQWVQTIKSDGVRMGGFSSRQEHEVAIAGEEPDFWKLGPFSEQMQPFLPQLQRLFATDFDRTAWRLNYCTNPCDRASQCDLVEIVLDEGEIRGAGDHVDPLGEIEIELISGRPAALPELALNITREAPLMFEPLSKAGRGHRLTGQEFKLQDAKPIHSIDEGLNQLHDAQILSLYGRQKEGEARTRHILAKMADLMPNQPELAQEARLIAGAAVNLAELTQWQLRLLSWRLRDAENIPEAVAQ